MKELWIITGLSGAGKSTALGVFEDCGFTCTDNMPTNLIATFVCENTGPFAVVVDSRTPGENPVSGISETASVLAGKARIRILFFDSTDEALNKRYSETRRTHPLARDGSIAEGIRKERILLGELKLRADRVLDTTGLNPHELREIVASSFSGEQTKPGYINIVSFGFKHGQTEADMIFDVRMLENPNFVPHLKPLDGNSGEIREFVMKDRKAGMIIERIAGMLDFVMKSYRGKDKPYLNVGIGCTGGRHRSVVVANELGKRLGQSDPELKVKISHRDIGGTGQ